MTRVTNSDGVHIEQEGVSKSGTVYGVDYPPPEVFAIDDECCTLTLCGGDILLDSATRWIQNHPEAPMQWRHRGITDSVDVLDYLSDSSNKSSSLSIFMTQHSLVNGSNCHSEGN